MATNLDILKVQIASIEVQLRALKARVEKLEKGTKPEPGGLVSLYGIWKGKADFTYEEIKEAEYKIKEEPEWST